MVWTDPTPPTVHPLFMSSPTVEFHPRITRGHASRHDEHREYPTTETPGRDAPHQTSSDTDRWQRIRLMGLGRALMRAWLRGEPFQIHAVVGRPDHPRDVVVRVADHADDADQADHGATPLLIFTATAVIVGEKIIELQDITNITHEEIDATQTFNGEYLSRSR